MLRASSSIGSGRTESDTQILKKQSNYLATHAKDYRPFTLCESVRCQHCVIEIREDANKFAAQIFSNQNVKLKTPEEIAKHIVEIPVMLSSRLAVDTDKSFSRICECIAVHLLRRCSIEKGISFSQSAIVKLLAAMNKQIEEGGSDNE